MAYAKPDAASPIAHRELLELTKSFSGSSMGQSYRGPGWVNDRGLACIVVIAPDDKILGRVRGGSGCAFIAWRWTNSPSATFSLTLVTKAPNVRPHARWMRTSEDPVVGAIRREGRFLVTVALPEGRHTGWMEAVFRDENGVATTHDLDALWEFPLPGIPNSQVGVRFDPVRGESFGGDHDREIPLWSEPESDFWSMLDFKGPWSEDLFAHDRARATWARQALLWRGRAAGFVQMLIERQEIDGVAPYVDGAGVWTRDDEFRQRVAVLVHRAPSIGPWLRAMIGPAPDAKAAYDAAFHTLHRPYDFFCVLDKLFEILRDLGDWALTEAVQANIEAVLLDARITQTGSKRPWLANAQGGYGLEIKASAFDLGAPMSEIRRTWVSGLQLMGLFDLGLRVGPSDFLAPLDVVCENFNNLTLEVTVEEAEAKVQALLREAQDARQWSIPWGARVQINFGTFTSVKIFESSGEFSCHFLDNDDRYFLVAIGLQSQPPNASCGHLIRHRADDGEPIWNSEAEVSMKLIAAAIVRDFVVVEEREALFTSRPMRRRIRGRDVRSIIYLPRVRYSTPHPERVDPSATPQGRAQHQVVPHLRKAKNASPAQRFLAERYGMHLPEGFTFVQPHARGSSSDETRVRVYRSRSASKMIFDEVAAAPAGTRPTWFDFEKDCQRMLTGKGMRVIHQAAHRDGDGGVDLFAVDSTGQTWVVQCKCWAAHRAVGPDVVRELAGAMLAADRGKDVQSRGMIITTSKLTEGARKEARELEFAVIEGSDFAADLAAPMLDPSSARQRVEPQ